MSAISQDKYIKISSTILNPTLGDRDLSGLVFTDATVSSSDDKYSVLIANYNANKIITFPSAVDVGGVFGLTSDEYKFATKYFNYVNPSGRSPRALNFKKYDTSPKDSIEKTIGDTNNFGSFTFLLSSSTVELDNYKEAYTFNAGLNFQFVAVHAEVFSNTSTHVTNATALGEISGTHFVVGKDKYAAYMPMAIMASVRYTNESSATCLMFKTFTDEDPVIDSDTEFETLVGANINFYGKTQINGRQLAFYQPGFNLDGLDTAVYMNEIWFKSQIVTNFFELMNSTERVPASYTGEAMITASVITPAINAAISNGVIMQGKNLSDEQIAAIFRYTGDENAATSILADGYWYDITIRLDDDGKTYKAVYSIVYSKGDSIRFVDGSHVLA